MNEEIMNTGIVETEEVACESLENIPEVNTQNYVPCDDDEWILIDILRGVLKVGAGIGIGLVIAKREEIKEFFEDRKTKRLEKKENKKAKKESKKTKKSNRSEKNKETEEKAEDANFEECEGTEESTESEEAKAPAKRNNKK